MSHALIHRIEAAADAFSDRYAQRAGHLMAVTAPEADAPEALERLAAAEPRLAADVARLINTPYFKAAPGADGLRETVEALGIRRLRHAAMTALAGRILWPAVEGYDLTAGELFRHCLGVSIAASHLNDILERPEAEDIFLAGLFHDVGKLILGPFVAAENEAIEAETARGLSFEIAERRVLGMDHTAVGRRILTRWGFPEALCRAVRWSHTPDEAAPTTAMADMLHICNVLCLSIGIGMGREGLRYKSSPAAARRVGVAPGTLELVASHTLQWINDLADILEFG